MPVIYLDDLDRRTLVVALRLLIERMQRDHHPQTGAVQDLEALLAVTDDSNGQLMPKLAFSEEARDSAFMTTAETAELLRVSERTVARRIADGSIPSVKVAGRRLVRREDLMEAIDG